MNDFSFKIDQILQTLADGDMSIGEAATILTDDLDFTPKAARKFLTAHTLSDVPVGYCGKE